MKVGIAQINCEPGETEKNLNRIEKFFKEGKSRGCKIVVFPEMATIGYELEKIKSNTETWPDRSIAKIKSIAKKYGIYLMSGIPQKIEDKIYNTMAACNPDGEIIGLYKKIHLFRKDTFDETKYFISGNDITIIEINKIKFGLIICYDIRFPELCRKMSQLGIDVIVIGSAWPLIRKNHLDILTQARAIENQVYLIASNRVGTDGSNTLCGSSKLIAPDGIIITEADDTNESLLIGEISLEDLRSTRTQMPVLKHRKFLI